MFLSVSLGSVFVDGAAHRKDLSDRGLDKQCPVQFPVDFPNRKRRQFWASEYTLTQKYVIVCVCMCACVCVCVQNMTQHRVHVSA